MDVQRGGVHFWTLTDKGGGLNLNLTGRRMFWPFTLYKYALFSCNIDCLNVFFITLFITNDRKYPRGPFFGAKMAQNVIFSTFWSRNVLNYTTISFYKLPGDNYAVLIKNVNTSDINGSRCSVLVPKNEPGALPVIGIDIFAFQHAPLSILTHMSKSEVKCKKVKWH